MGLPSQGGQNKSLTSVVSPQWDSYRQINADSYQAIQVPLDDGNHYAARTYSLDSLGRATMEKSSWQSYLVVARIGQKSRMRSFVATLIPSRDYHERKSGWKSGINFAPEGSDFTGMVLYSSLEGQFYSGTTFRDGRVVGRIQSEQCDSTQCAEGGSCEACHKPSSGLKHLVLCLYGPEDLVLNRAICPETGIVYNDGEQCPGCGMVHLFVVEVTTGAPVYYCWGCLANLSAGEACQCCHYCWSPPGGHEQWCLYYEPEGEGEDGGEDGGDPEGGSSGGGSGSSSSSASISGVVIGNIGNNDAPIGVPYTPQSGDKFAGPNTPTQMTANQSQVANTCVFSSMSYLSTLYGGSNAQGYYMLKYLQFANVPILDFDGVPEPNFGPFVMSQFIAVEITPSSADAAAARIPLAIDSGAPILLANYNSDGKGHAITVVGYQSSGGGAIFMDPLSGTLRVSTSSSPINLSKMYIIGGPKN